MDKDKRTDIEKSPDSIPQCDIGPQCDKHSPQPDIVSMSHGDIGSHRDSAHRIKQGKVGRLPEIAGASMVFSITILLFISIGYRVQRRELYSGLLITEFGLILLPALLYLLISRYKLKNVLRLNRTRLINIPLIFAIMLFAIPLAGLVNMLNLALVNLIFGKVMMQQIPIAQNGRELIVSILIIAGSAGLCEEFLYRGLIQRSYEKFGKTRAILMAAFLFSLTHMDFQKIFGTFFLGVLIGFIVYKTNSLYCGIFAHFLNNALAVLISYVAVKYLSFIESSDLDMPLASDLGEIFAGFGELPKIQQVLAITVYAIIFSFIAAVFVLLFYALVRANREKVGSSVKLPAEEIQPKRDIQAAKLPRPVKMGLLWLLPGIMLVAGVYYLEAHNLMGVENMFTELLIKLLGIG